MRINAIDDFFAVQFHIRAEQTIPKREDIAVIGVRIRQFVVVVYLVHIGRDDDPAQRVVQPLRQADIGMVELRQQHRHRLIHEHNPDRRTRQHHSHRGENKTKHALAGMVAIGRGGVHCGICVVNEVETPHPAHFVFRPMYEPGADEIEQEQSRDGIRPQRHVGQPLQNAEVVGHCPVCRLE